MARVIFIISSSKYVLFLLADVTRSKISFRETTLTTCPVSYFPIEFIIDLPRSGKKKKKKKRRFKMDDLTNFDLIVATNFLARLINPRFVQNEFV